MTHSIHLFMTDKPIHAFVAQEYDFCLGKLISPLHFFLTSVNVKHLHIQGRHSSDFVPDFYCFGDHAKGFQKDGFPSERWNSYGIRFR